MTKIQTRDKGTHIFKRDTYQERRCKLESNIQTKDQYIRHS